MSDVIAKNFSSAKEKSDYCLQNFPQSHECIWINALINIYLGDIKTGKEFVQKAKEAGYGTENEISLRQLVSAYLETKNYQEMLPLYQNLYKINPAQIQYKVSIMLCYKELGNYATAKQLGGEIIKSNPELKPQIENFLASF